MIGLRSVAALGGVLAVLAAFAAGVVQGHRAERKTWQLTVARQTAVAAQVLAAAEAAARAREHDLATLKDQIAKEHLDAEAKIAALRTDTARRLAAAGGLRDTAARCSANSLPGDSPAAAGPATAAAGGCQLSAAASRDLLDLAALADRTAAYAAACHSWVGKIAE